MKLRAKLAGAFALVVVAGSVASGLAIAAALRNRMQAFVFQSDVARARNLQAFLGDYYERRGSLEGAFDDFSPRFPDMPMMRRGPGQGRGGGMPGMMRRNDFTSARVILVDPAGTVLFDSAAAPPLSGAAPEVVARGVPVEAAGAVVGYVASGSMIDPALGGLERGFLDSVSLAVLVSTLAATLLAVAAGTAVVLQITRPLKSLERATERIAAGDFGFRTTIARRDEIGELAENFNRMAGALEENELLRRKLVDDAAHELRTPVSLLKANVEMMLEGVYPIDRANLLSLSEEIGRLSLLVQGLDALNRADAGAAALRKTNCRLQDLVERALAPYRVPLAEKKIVVRTDFPEGFPPLEADPDKLIQVFSNILANAVRHVNPGGSIAVTLSHDPDEKQATVRFENSGSSVPPADLERIFERFYRSDPARSRDGGGSGLGLAIAREIVRRHGGRIWAENAAPDGVRFSVELPLSH